METLSATSGIPLRVVRAKILGPCPSAARECSIRAQEKSPELPAESNAEMTTKFMMSAAAGSPARSKTVTKGLSSRPALLKGTMAAITAMAPMKKTVSLMTAVRIARGMERCGSSASPAATPISSVPLKA